MTDMLTVFAAIALKPEHFAEARAAVRDIVARTRAEPGCHQFQLHEDAKSHRLFLYEAWHGQAGYDAHHAQPYTKAVFRAYEQWLAEPVDLLVMRPVEP